MIHVGKILKDTNPVVENCTNVRQLNSYEIKKGLNEIYVRSTRFGRTIETAQGIVAGIVDSQPCEVDIEVVHDDIETLIPAPGRNIFPFMAQIQQIVRQHANKDEEIIKYAAKSARALGLSPDIAGQLTAWPRKTVIEFAGQLYDSFVCRNSAGLFDNDDQEWL